MNKRILLSEFTRYFFVCLICFGVDFSLLVALKEMAGFHYLLAGLVGILSGNLLNYALSIKWVFTSRKLEDKKKELGIFLMLGMGAIPFHHLILWFSTDSLGIHYQVSKLIAVGATFLLIFILRKIFLF